MRPFWNDMSEEIPLFTKHSPCTLADMADVIEAGLRHANVYNKHNSIFQSLEKSFQCTETSAPWTFPQCNAKNREHWCSLCSLITSHFLNPLTVTQ